MAITVGSANWAIPARMRRTVQQPAAWPGRRYADPSRFQSIATAGGRTNGSTTLCLHRPLGQRYTYCWRLLSNAAAVQSLPGLNGVVDLVALGTPGQRPGPNVDGGQ